MKVLLLQLDGKMPNLALMRLAAHHRSLGDDVELRQMRTASSVSRHLWDEAPGKVYASLIFESSRTIASRVREIYPLAVIGGPGSESPITLESIGVTNPAKDYDIYPAYEHSIGYTQRGCRLKCSFCKVPQMEPKLEHVANVSDIWRGDPWPRNLLLLDNDFFGQREWPELIESARSGEFKVCFNQGVNIRTLTEEQAEAIASVRYSDDQFKTKRLYTAWDNRKDEDRLFRGLERLRLAGVSPDSIMVYMLIGYWDGPRLTEDDFFRHQRLREFGCRPYPMPYVRNDPLRGFQRWVIGAYDKRIPWSRWEAAKYEPRNLGQACAATEAP